MFKNLLNWLKARASEKSTYIGIATLAATLIPGAAPIAHVVVGVLGGGLMAATTTPTRPSDASVVGTGG